MRLTAPKHSPFFEMTSIQSIPSLRPLSHMPPSEIGILVELEVGAVRPHVRAHRSASVIAISPGIVIAARVLIAAHGPTPAVALP